VCSVLAALPNPFGGLGAHHQQRFTLLLCWNSGAGLGAKHFEAACCRASRSMHMHAMCSLTRTSEGYNCDLSRQACGTADVGIAVAPLACHLGMVESRLPPIAGRKAGLQTHTSLPQIAQPRRKRRASGCKGRCRYPLVIPVEKPPDHATARSRDAWRYSKRQGKP
jgi:hypothetical protein